MIKFVSDLRQIGGFLRVLRFPPPIKLIATNDIAEILLKVALNTIKQSTCNGFTYTSPDHSSPFTNILLMTGAGTALTGTSDGKGVIPFVLTAGPGSGLGGGSCCRGYNIRLLHASIIISCILYLFR